MSNAQELEIVAEGEETETVSDTERPPASAENRVEIALDPLTEAALQEQMGKIKLPDGVKLENGVVSLPKKEKQKFIKVTKSEEKDIRDFLNQKNAPKPTVAIVNEAPKKPDIPNIPVEAAKSLVTKPIVQPGNPQDENEKAIKAFAYNMFHVMPQGMKHATGVVVTNPCFGPITADQAINLAVWLVRIARDNGASLSFGELMQTVDQLTDGKKL